MGILWQVEQCLLKYLPNCCTIDLPPRQTAQPFVLRAVIVGVPAHESVTCRVGDARNSGGGLVNTARQNVRGAASPEGMAR